MKIPLHEQLIRHREIYVEEGYADKSEEAAMAAFGIGSSTPSLFKMATQGAPVFAKPFSHEGTISNGPGPLKDWTKIREFPAPHGSNFRKWFKDHKKGERRNG
ncbi:Lactate utilization protein B [Lentibacillus sp. JNUCC-1]|nr:Lactate utilization protein B [Lentibacillus sp. JNUCC-1]